MANQADVRVRLSAEGQAEVIAAFQKIASEGKKSGHEASLGMHELNEKLKEVGKTLTGGIGIVLVAEKFAEFFKSTLEGAEALDRLKNQTGLSTAAIQVYRQAARETGIDQETVNNALTKFTVNVGKAGIGSKGASQALSDLGISVRDFSKLSPDQQLAAVAEKLAAIPDPARRARDEVALFGKAGVSLDQTLIKVGKEGMEPFLKHLQDLGVFLDTDSIEAIRGANESFRNMGDTIKGLATQFLTGLVPGMAAAADELSRVTNSDGVSGLKKVGEAVGYAFRLVVNALEHTGNNIAALIVKTQIFFSSIGSQIKNIFNPAEVKRLAQQAQAAIDEVSAENERRNKEADDRLNAQPEKPKIVDAKTGDEGAVGAQAAALAKARLSLLEARLDNELKLYNAHAVLVRETDRQAYQDGQISLTEYYARRAAQINGALDREIATLRAKRAAVAGTAVDINDPVGEINKQKQLDSLKTEIHVKELQRVAELQANTNEQSNSQRKLYEDTLKAEERLLTIAGKKTEAARLKLALDIADMDAQLRKGGVSDSDRAGAEATVAGQGTAQIDFTEKSAQAQAALAQLETARKGIENQVRDGELFSIDAAQKIVALDKERLPALQANAAAMTELAKATGNADDVSKAEAYKQKIDAIAASTNQLGIQTAQLKAGVESAVGAGINKFLTDAVSNTHTLKQSFVDMGLAMLQTLEQVAIKMLETAALKSLFGAAALADGGAVGGAGAAPGHAEGGHIRGPGTSTSDSIPARLSDGEFVVNAKTTSQPGILPLLTALNAGSLKGINGPTQVPKFAAGGQVGGSGGPPVIKLVNVLDPTTLGDHLQTDAGERGVLNIISRNPSKIRNSLG
jgi:hypothetical protein